MDSDFSRGCTKNANSTFWDSAALTGERRQMAISYTLSLYIHLSCIWGMQMNQTGGGIRMQTTAHERHPAWLYSSQHTTLLKRLVWIPTAGHLTVACRSICQSFLAVFCVFCVTLSERIRAPGHRSFFFFFPSAAQSQKELRGRFSRQQCQQQKKRRERKKRLEVLITDHPELRRPIKRTQLATT